MPNLAIWVQLSASSYLLIANLAAQFWTGLSRLAFQIIYFSQGQKLHHTTLKLRFTYVVKAATLRLSRKIKKKILWTANWYKTPLKYFSKEFLAETSTHRPRTHISLHNDVATSKLNAPSHYAMMRSPHMRGNLITAFHSLLRRDDSKWI